MSLYELTPEELAIEAELIENGGELTPELEERLSLAGEEFESQVDRRVRWIRSLYARAEARNEEAARIGKLGRADSSLADRLTARLKDALERRKIMRLDSGIAHLVVIRNSKPSIKPEVPAEELPRYLREKVPATWRFSYQSALERWKSGKPLRGCTVRLDTHLRGIK